MTRDYEGTDHTCTDCHRKWDEYDYRDFEPSVDEHEAFYRWYEHDIGAYYRMCWECWKKQHDEDEANP